MENTFFSSNFAKQSKFDSDFVENILNNHQWIRLANQYEKYFNNYDEKDNKALLIPKKIHQIWLGHNKLPRKYIKWMKSWKKYNIGWEYKLWDEQNIKELNSKNFNIYSKEINPGYRSDIVRYIILKKYGGIYIDTDFECLKSIPENLLHYKFVSSIVFDNKPQIANGMMMSAPNFILLDNILNSINEKDYKNNIKKIIEDSGPAKLTKEYFSIIQKIEGETLILPSNYFYPYPNFLIKSKINRYTEIENETIGLHHWEMSWMKGNLISRIKRKLKFFLNLFSHLLIKDL
tara:strand:+ start:4984 stop:5853 length:870 start_codon:yes stop_codon:yes gene_type:complete